MAEGANSSTPKMSDVAALAGISVPTVSKVLNNRQDIADVTRKRVEDAIARSGYQRRPARARPARHRSWMSS